MKEIIIELNRDWVLKHRNDETLPISQIAHFLDEAYKGNLILISKTFSVLICDLVTDSVTDKEVVEKINKFLAEKYSDFKSNYLKVVSKSKNSDKIALDDFIVTGGADIDDSDEDDALGETDKTEHEGQATKGNSKMVSSFFERFRTSASDHGDQDKDVEQHRGDADRETSNSEKLSEMEQIVDKTVTVSGAEFKVLAKELRDISSQIKKNHADDIIIAQKYLFSIGDGCGLSLYLKLLRDTINAMDLDKLDLDDDIIFGKIPPQDPKAVDIAETYLQPFKHPGFSKHVVCADISEWMQRINSEEFREILRELLNICSGDIIVFSIPFVEKELFDTIADALNDMMFIRKISFPPFTMEEIRGLAESETARFGFSMDETAWENFRRRIIRESSDGRFHGVDTVNKVVHEMLYVKQLKNASEGVDETIVDVDDTKSLCPDDFSHNQSGMEMLESMVGTDEIKQKILEIISQIKMAKQNSEMGMPCLHMRFLGNPGTGKTTVARIIGKILKENGILRIGEFHEHSGRDFCGRYIGETAPKTSGICRDAYGSVLFIDEAYSLFRGGDDTKDFGREALDTLIAEMENHRNDLVVIMAGYTDDMEKLMEGNAGLLSRMPYSIEFPNFTREQLCEIFRKMVDGKIKCDEVVLQRANEYFLGLDEDWIQSKQFSNGRFVRNLFERCCAKAAMRCQLDGTDKISITEDDFVRSIGDKDFLARAKRRRIGFGD